MSHKINFGEIWLADLSTKSGTELGKTRPVLIMQNQVLLDIEHPSTIIIPLTTKLVEEAQPLRIRIHAVDKLEKDSDLLIDQIRAIDNKRLIKGPLTQCSQDFIKVVQKALLEVIDYQLDE